MPIQQVQTEGVHVKYLQLYLLLNNTEYYEHVCLLLM